MEPGEFQILFEAPAQVLMSLEDRNSGFEGCFRLIRHPSGDVRGFLFCDLELYPFLAPYGYYRILLEDLSPLQRPDEALFRISRESRDWYLLFHSQGDVQRFSKTWADVLGR